MSLICPSLARYPLPKWAAQAGLGNKSRMGKSSHCQRVAGVPV